MPPEMRENLSDEFLNHFATFFAKCRELSFLLLKLLTEALEMEDKEYFKKAHGNIGQFGNDYTSFCVLSSNQKRCNFARTMSLSRAFRL